MNAGVDGIHAGRIASTLSQTENTNSTIWKIILKCRVTKDEILFYENLFTPYKTSTKGATHPSPPKTNSSRTIEPSA